MSRWTSADAVWRTRAATRLCPLCPPALLREVRERLAGEADPNLAAFGEGYHPTTLRITGVRTPVLRQLAADLARRVEEPSDAVELASRLVATDGCSERTLAYLLLSRHRAALASLRAGQIEALGGGNDNWGSVDAFGTLVAGPAWLAGQLDDARIKRWARSPDRWWRRAALVSTTALNKKSAGSTGDAPRTLAICACCSTTATTWS